VSTALLASLMTAVIVHPVQPVNDVAVHQAIAPVPTVAVWPAKPSIAPQPTKPTKPTKPATVVVVMNVSPASLWCRHVGPVPLNRPPCPCGIMTTHKLAVRGKTGEP
jgi:hypothetical protein